MFLGIDIGGTNIQFASINRNNQILDHWEIKTPKLGSTLEWYDFLYDNSKAENNYKGIGVSVPGVVLEDGFIASKASLRLHNLYETNIKEELNKRFHVPVAALNDGKAAALCELKMGSAKGSTSSITFIIGTAIGGGVTYRDHLIMGHDGFSGEFSSILVYYEGKMVSLAQLAGAPGLIYQYNKNSNSTVDEAKEVFKLYHQGDLHAIEAMTNWIYWIVYGFHQLTVIYNPDVICIGGGVSNAPILLPLLKATYKDIMANLNKVATISTDLVLCSAPSQATLHGAILHLFNKYEF